MAATSPGIDAVDRLLVLLNELELIIAEVREQAQRVKEDNGDAD